MPDDTTSIALRGLATAHNAAIDALVAAFNEHVAEIVKTASARTLAILEARLEYGKTAPHLIDANPANSKVLRGVDQLFAEQMKEAGYDALVDSYVKRFGTQFRYFGELLAIVAPGHTVDFTAEDKSWFRAQQLASADSLKACVDIVGALAQQRIAFGVGGMPIADLAETLAARFETTIAAAARIADTSITVFYRSIAERGFADIERGLPADAIRYHYFGPDDKLTRPFCQRLVESGKTYTRAEIDLMNNHQLPVGTCMVTAGGFNCRHSWLLTALIPTSEQPA
jgi:hypothetical protein